MTGISLVNLAECTSKEVLTSTMAPENDYSPEYANGKEVSIKISEVNRLAKSDSETASEIYFNIIKKNKKFEN